MAAKPKAGSPEAKKAFYHQQRLDADKKGDNATSAKIYDKLNAAQYGKSMAGAKKRQAANFQEIMTEGNSIPKYPNGAPNKKAKKTSLGGHRGT
jgi:hypothetical protein